MLDGNFAPFSTHQLFVRCEEKRSCCLHSINAQRRLGSNRECNLVPRWYGIRAFVRYYRVGWRRLCTAAKALINMQHCVGRKYVVALARFCDEHIIDTSTMFAIDPAIQRPADTLTDPLTNPSDFWLIDRSKLIKVGIHDKNKKIREIFQPWIISLIRYS